MNRFQEGGTEGEALFASTIAASSGDCGPGRAKAWKSVDWRPARTRPDRLDKDKETARRDPVPRQLQL
ncbi:hypothetical protein GCM10011316_08900 [Roseibium aquae]|uniref:Uncharacterized protein n=1 Tax=Roseibium aquae TaxID=1323746 RepID=A0A916WX12_9HYPH|nr:hypothetical protein GCM10011316_08900 [Roseibium aquae]